MNASMQSLRPNARAWLTLLAVATAACGSLAQGSEAGDTEIARRLADMQARDAAMAVRLSMPEKQLAFLALLEEARDIDVCDRAAVVRHFGAWLDEELTIAEAMTLSPGQNERLKELREEAALGLSAYWQGVGSKRPRGSSCTVQFHFTDSSPAGAVTRKAYSTEAIRYLFSLCAERGATFSHGQQPWTWRSCPSDRRRNQIVFSFVDSTLRGVYVFNENGLQK